MAEVALSPNASVDARTSMYAQQNTGLVLAEDVEAGMALRIGEGWKVYKASGAAGSRFDGVAPKKMRAGQPITLFGVGARFHATDAELDPTKAYYPSATTPGGWADAGAGQPVARAVSRRNLEVIRVGVL